MTTVLNVIWLVTFANVAQGLPSYMTRMPVCPPGKEEIAKTCYKSTWGRDFPMEDLSVTVFQNESVVTIPAFCSKFQGFNRCLTKAGNPFKDPSISGRFCEPPSSDYAKVIAIGREFYHTFQWVCEEGISPGLDCMLSVFYPLQVPDYCSQEAMKLIQESILMEAEDGLKVISHRDARCVGVGKMLSCTVEAAYKMCGSPGSSWMTGLWDAKRPTFEECL